MEGPENSIISGFCMFLRFYASQGIRKLSMLLKELIRKEFKYLILFKETKRKWHIPLVATLCTGVPLLVGLYFGNLQNGLLACLCGMVILYLPDSGSLTNRMVTVLICSFGFLVSFTVGL